MRLLNWAMLLALSFTSCQKHNPETGDMVPFERSRWIGSPLAEPADDSLKYEHSGAVRFRKPFDLGQSVKSAVLRITAAGYYSVWVNGTEAAEYRLDPAWTDYSKRIWYREIDVTRLLAKGENLISAELAGGWYDPLPLRLWGHLNLRKQMPVGKPALLAELAITLEDGSVTIIPSDQTWRTAASSIYKTSVYLGEWVDESIMPANWNELFWQDNGWSFAAEVPGPGGLLMPAPFPPVVRSASYKPADIWMTADSAWIIDFGTNLAGIIRYEGPSTPGDTLIFRFGERIYPDSTLNVMTGVAGQIKRKGVGGPGAPDVAYQVNGVVPAGDRVLFEPRYTFHGFRYVEVTGMKDKPMAESFTAFRLNTDVAVTGTLTTDADWLNRMLEVSNQTFLSNLAGVQSDCPAREKFGYGGDINATAESYLFMHDMKDFYVKTLHDWADAMRDSVFVDTAPFVGIKYCGLSWESAYLLVQNQLFNFYRDTALVREWYPANLRWMDKVKLIHPEGLVRQGLGDHESLKPVPPLLTGTMHHLQVLRAMHSFAGAVKDTAGTVRFKTEVQNLENLIIDSLWNRPPGEIRNRQSWYAALLYHDVLQEDERAEATRRLLESIEEEDGGLITGIFGTQWILEALSKSGNHQLAFDLVAREDYPGWRHMINHGATTLWETWKESDNTFSQNHPMFGSVVAWLYRWLAGFRMEGAPGARILLAPAPVEDVNRLSATLELPEGEVRVEWHKRKNRLIFKVRLPGGVTSAWKPMVPDGYSQHPVKGISRSGKNSQGDGMILDGGKTYRFTHKALTGMNRAGRNKQAELAIFHAGSLSVPMQRIARAFEAEHPEVRVLLEAAGSLACVRKVTELNREADLIALADWELIDQFLIPDYTRENILFATNTLCVAYLPGSRGADTVNQENWYRVVASPSVRFGRSDPDSDPCGYRTLMMFQLAEKFYDGFDRVLLEQKDLRFIRPKEADLNALLESGNIDYIFTYRSVAIQHGFSYLDLPDEINLGNPVFEDQYAGVSVDIPGERPGIRIDKRGSTMYYGLAVLDRAPRRSWALRFRDFMLDPEKGLLIIREAGQGVINPEKSPASR